MEALFVERVAELATVRAYRTKRHPEFLAERTAGYEDGLEAGLAERLRCQLAHRYGVLEPLLDALVAAASSSELERYLERILTAETAAAVFADD